MNSAPRNIAPKSERLDVIAVIQITNAPGSHRSMAIYRRKNEILANDIKGTPPVISVHPNLQMGT